MAEPLLVAIWIDTPFKHGPIGFGVTAYSIEDAIKIITGWGFDLPQDRRLLTIREGITFAEIDNQNVIANMGPMVNRGLWYPFAGLGVPRWMYL